MTIEDVIKKTFIPLAFMAFWAWMSKTIIEVSGTTELFWFLLILGLPYGIHKMCVILVPGGAAAVVMVFQIIFCALFGCVIAAGTFVRAVYVLIRFLLRR